MRKKRDSTSVFNDQHNEFDNKKNNSDSITANRNPSSDNEVSNKIYVEYSIGESEVVRFNQTLRNYLKVSVRNDTYDLTKYDKIQITDTTTSKDPSSGGYLLQNWNIKCKNKKIMVK